MEIKYDTIKYKIPFEIFNLQEFQQKKYSIFL